MTTSIPPRKNQTDPSSKSTLGSQVDRWSSEEYQSAAAFVPKLATKIVGWLDVQPGDVILDVGCGGMYFDDS